MGEFVLSPNPNVFGGWIIPHSYSNDWGINLDVEFNPDYPNVCIEHIIANACLDTGDCSSFRNDSLASFAEHVINYQILAYNK